MEHYKKDANHKEFYLIEIRFCQKQFYAVWESNDTDCLLKNGDSILIKNNKRFDGIVFASEDIAVYDFDYIRNLLDFCYGKTTFSIFENLRYKELLNFWNLSQDAAHTIGYTLMSKKEKFDALYQKIFYANNILKPPHEKDYDPELTKKDRENICMIVSQMIEMWSEIIGGITKEIAKTKLQRKYGFSSRKNYHLVDNTGVAESFFIMRGTIDIYEAQIKNYLLKKYGPMFYLSSNDDWHSAWHRDRFELTTDIDFGAMREEEVLFPKDFSFLIYIFHEQTITFAGEIVNDIKKILAPISHKFDKYPCANLHRNFNTSNLSAIPSRY